MARKPKTVSSIANYIRAPIDWLVKHGKSLTSKIYINIKNGFSISQRTYVNTKTAQSTGEVISRETYSKQVEIHKRTYSSERVAKGVATRQFNRKARASIFGITDPDLRILRKILDNGGGRSHGIKNILTSHERAEFNKMFSRYSREEVLDFIGSPIIVKKQAA